MSNSPREDLLLAEGIDLFRLKFSADPFLCAYAPGRVNLIGEHTDYNDGFVLPFALPYRTYVIGSIALNTNISTVYSSSQDEKATFKINGSICKGEPIWANYVKGTIFQYLSEIGSNSSNFAFNAVIVSNVPLGSGLSSSAALEVATATFLEGLLGSSVSVSGVAKALRCQKAEHTFADTPCGIMDQYISAMGQKGSLLLIDCRTNSYELIPFGATATTPATASTSPIVLVTNSLVKHTLSGSEYPDRVRQCKEAVAAIKLIHPSVEALRDATLDMLNSVESELSDVVYRRAKHVIGEDIRTQSAVAALKSGDYATVGQLMTASHYSLKDDYEVSCAELDFLVEVANKVPGVYGSRMTGGGFGGCTVTLVAREDADLLEASLKDYYQRLQGKKCEIYRAEPSEGSDFFPFAELSEEMRSVREKKKRQQQQQQQQTPISQATSLWINWRVPIVVALTAVAIFSLLRSK